MHEPHFDKAFDRVVNEQKIPSGHFYSRDALRKLCLQVALELEDAGRKYADDVLRNMGFNDFEIRVIQQEDRCKVCPDQCGAFAKSTKPSEHKRENFLREHSMGCRCKEDLIHRLGEGLGDWEGIYYSDPEPIFFSNIKELIKAFKMWRNSK